MGRKYRSKWDHIIDAAAEIVESYDTRVTLRQLFYRLIAAEFIENSDSSYKQLSSHAAEGRREGTFPELMDTTRQVAEPMFFDDAADAIRYVGRFYREDRLVDQPHSVYLGVEKRGLIAQLDSWFGKPYGIPILPLGGFSSQSFIDVIKSDVVRREQVYGRKSVLLYAGDFDASGVAIDRVFNERTAGYFAEIRRVALNPGQVKNFGLVRQPGKPDDNNIWEFFRQYGSDAMFAPDHLSIRGTGQNRQQVRTPVQVEMDALDPNDLRTLFTDAITEFLDLSEISYRADDEVVERQKLSVLAELAERFTTEQLRAIVDGADQ